MTMNIGGGYPMMGNNMAMVGGMGMMPGMGNMMSGMSGMGGSENVTRAFTAKYGCENCFKKEPYWAEYPKPVIPEPAVALRPTLCRRVLDAIFGR